MPRPTSNEYKSAFEPYVSLAKGDSVGELVTNHNEYLLDFIANIPEDRAGYSYAAGKWNVKEVLQHIIDMERVFAYRALAIARGYILDLPGVDQDAFAQFQRAQYRAFSDLQEEFLALRSDHNILFRSFDKTALIAEGLVTGHKCTCRSWIYISFGHALYHVQILKERYGIQD